MAQCTRCGARFDATAPRPHDCTLCEACRVALTVRYRTFSIPEGSPVLAWIAMPAAQRVDALLGLSISIAELHRVAERHAALVGPDLLASIDTSVEAHRLAIATLRELAEADVRDAGEP